MRYDFEDQSDDPILRQADHLSKKVLAKFLNKAIEKDFLFFKYAVYMALSKA